MKGCAVFVACLCLISSWPASAQDRPGLLFREDWKESEAATPITPEHVAHPDLTLGLYGPGRGGIKKSHHDSPADDPFYVWSGECDGNWAVTLAHGRMVDLSGQAKIRWRAKQEGARRLHVIVKLADGRWLVSDQADGESRDWRVVELPIMNLTWRDLDIETVVEGRRVEKPDLSRVAEIGFTDLMRGGGSRACSRLDWIEVYGIPAAPPASESR